MTHKICNFCKGTEFIQPHFRKEKSLSYCNKCFSLERHRILKSLLDKLKNDKWSSYNVLHLSHEPCIELIYDWFKNVEHSEYGGNNSIDLTNIEREDNSYNIIFCNHILEHIEDDKTALHELVRILAPAGLLFITVPAPTYSKKTYDWGYPNELLHGHYRTYGEDFEQTLLDTLNGKAHVFVHMLTDIITDTKDLVFVIEKI